MHEAQSLLLGERNKRLDFRKLPLKLLAVSDLLVKALLGDFKLLLEHFLVPPGLLDLSPARSHLL